MSQRSLRDSSFLSDDQAYATPGSREHVDEAVDAEELDLAAHEIANPRLRYTKEPSGLGLRESAIVNELPNTRHQSGTDPQMSGLVRVEAEISEYIPTRPLNFRDHGPLPPVPCSNDFGVSRSPKLDIRLPRPLGLLLEGVQHVDPLSERRHIEHPILPLRTNPDLPHPCADIWHRLPVIRVLSTLHQEER
jgi:hypothetical protein